MKTISINDIYTINKTYTFLGYHLYRNDSGVLSYKKGDNEIVFYLHDYINVKLKLIRPNYNNCVINLIDSIRKYFNEEVLYETNDFLDKILKEKKYKHIAIMLLDGMGSYILRKNLDSDSFLLKNKVCDISAVYPSTTSCSIPALNSGLIPAKTGWVGWSNYFEEIKRYVIMFKNTDYYTNEKLEIDVMKMLPYDKFYKNFDTYKFELGPIWHESSCETFSILCEKYLDTIKKHDSSICYMYWDDPDYTMHETGSYSPSAKKVLENINKTVEEFYKKLDENTLVIVTADHGHIDCNPIYLSRFPDIISCLKRMPSNEPRCAFFSVKRNSKKRFVKLFNMYFGSYYTLISKDDFISEGYLGETEKYNDRLDSFIGDYVAVAKGSYFFNFNPKSFSDLDEEMLFKSHHAGITANEMIVPLILLKK